MEILIKNVRVVREHDYIDDCDVRAADGKIIEVGCGLKSGGASIIYDGGGSYLTAGFIDMHVHGGNGSDFMDATAQDFETITAYHAARGTTSMLATTLTASDEEFFGAIECYNEFVKSPYRGSKLIGLHLEGPYFNYEQRGAQDPKYLRNPAKEHYERIFAATPHIKRWSAAPELEGIADFAKACEKRGIVLSIGHSSCDAQTALEAMKHGFNLITHFYSGMNGVFRRNCYRVAGLVEAGYLYDGFKVELIADGCHLPSEILSLALKVKGEERIALVTDCSSASGTSGESCKIGSRKNGLDAFVENGVAFLADRSGFAGSVATTDRLLETMLNLTQASVRRAVRMLNLTPAEILGIDKTKGRIEKGYDADIVIFDYKDKKVNIKKVFIEGKEFI